MDEVNPGGFMKYTVSYQLSEFNSDWINDLDVINHCIYNDQDVIEITVFTNDINEVLHQFPEDGFGGYWLS